MKGLLRLLVWVHVLLFPQLATGASVWILADPEDDYHRRLAATLQTGSGEGIDWSFQPWSVAEPTGPGRPELIVTLGSRAAGRTAAWEGPVFHAFITHSQLQALYGEDVPSGRGALFLDQPLGRYVTLIRAALPEVTQLLLPRSSRAPDGLAELRRAAKAAGLGLHEVAVVSPQELDAMLEQAEPKRSAVLFLPDPALRSNAMMKVAVVGAYRRAVPLVAYSEGLVMAGALMAVHTTVSLHAEEVAGLVQSLLTARQVARPAYPTRFELTVNYRLAESLGLRMPKAAALREKMREVSRGG